MQTQEEREREVFLRSVNIGSEDFLKDLPQVHYLWQLYYSAGVSNSLTFKDWLIELTEEEYEANADRYWVETGFRERD
mgnify:CR=1 FL=1|tara:strand:- start:246 stop:479 length:234 start_codon:yes stop_codon:yes gene_type:complete